MTLQRATAWFALACGCQTVGSKATPEGQRAGAVQPAAKLKLEAAPELHAAPVSLSGESRALTVAVVERGAPRVFSRALRTWVHERPSRDAARLGYLRAGASSPTTQEPASNDGCKGGWYPVEPRGFVCVGGEATLEPQDPMVVLTSEHRPDPARKLPYIYGTVRNPGPVYARLPDARELRDSEPDIDKRLLRWLSANGEIGAGYAPHVWLGGAGQPPDAARVWQDKTSDSGLDVFRGPGALPSVLGKTRDARELIVERMRPRVGYAFLHTFLFEGRRYGLSTHLELLPVDRLRPIQGSDFHGVEIGKDVEFPFAFIRKPAARYWQRSGRSLIDAGEAAYRAAVRLTGKQQFFRGRLHYETVDGKWLSDLDASRLDPARRMPGWGKKGEKWIDVNLTKQTLLLYEGEKPVYATLISSGEAGLEDPAHTTATKRGIFRIHTKHVTATMSSDEAGEEFELRDVPYVQYFDKEGYALHGAYWHDRFGIPKSHGCINLAPEDARRIFYWTEPAVPVGWHGALKPLEGTVMFVHP
jgi:hypothetical protein